MPLALITMSPVPSTPSQTSIILARQIGTPTVKVALHGITEPHGAGLEPPSSLQLIGAVDGGIGVVVAVVRGERLVRVSRIKSII